MTVSVNTLLCVLTVLALVWIVVLPYVLTDQSIRRDRRIARRS